MIWYMQYATNVSLWKRLLNVLSVGLEYFLALVPSPWPCFFCTSLALNAVAMNTKSLKTSLNLVVTLGPTSVIVCYKLWWHYFSNICRHSLQSICYCCDCRQRIHIHFTGRPTSSRRDNINDHLLKTYCCLIYVTWHIISSLAGMNSDYGFLRQIFPNSAGQFAKFAGKFSS